MADLDTVFGEYAPIAPIAGSKRSTLDLSKLTVERVDPSNIHILWDELLPLQGDAHLTTIKGTEDAFRTALLSEDAERRILEGFILRTTEGENIGYVLVSDMHTPEGPTVYLEDNFIHENHRGRGLGTLLFDVLRVVAGPGKIIACTVDDSKKDTQNFYTSRVGMTMETVPLLGMGDFELKNSGKGTVVITAREAEDSRPPIHLLYTDIQPETVRYMTHDDVIELHKIPAENFRIGEQIADKHALVPTFSSAVGHARNFGLVSLDENGQIKAVSLVSRTFSTFNNFSRANLGPTISTTGKLPDPSDVLSHVAFCQTLPFASRIELKLDPQAARETELSKVAKGCVSNMTEENADSYERGFKVKVTDADFHEACSRLPVNLKIALDKVLNGDSDAAQPTSLPSTPAASAPFVS